MPWKGTFMSCRLLMIIILLCSIPPVAAGQDGEKPRDQQLDELRREVIQLRQEIAGLHTQLPRGDSAQSGELDQLEERLERRAEQLENKIDAVSRSVAPIAFNPKMVTAVNFAARSDNKEVIDPSPNQSVISNRPFLRTVEVELSSAVDPYASAFAVISLENQANKEFGIDAEEAYGLIKRLPIIESAPLGLKLKV